MKVLVTGASGLVGGRLSERLACRVRVVAARHSAAVPDGLPSVPLDLASAASTAAALDAARPDAVLHAAALADPDRCEREPALAELVNARGPETLARLCRRRSLRLVALSTDLVFGGDRAHSTEQTPPSPLATYARTKRLGEEAVLAESPGAAVARLPLVIGRGYGGRGTATESVAWSLAAGRELRLFTDQYRTPVDPDSLADALEKLLQGGGRGCFHLGGPERVSRYELGLRTARIFGLDAGLVIPASQADAPLGAPRPADVSLDSSRARIELGWSPLDVDAAIRSGRTAPDIIPR